jgi:hypothetical protein
MGDTGSHLNPTYEVAGGSMLPSSHGSSIDQVLCPLLRSSQQLPSLFAMHHGARACGHGLVVCLVQPEDVHKAGLINILHALPQNDVASNHESHIADHTERHQAEVMQRRDHILQTKTDPGRTVEGGSEFAGPSWMSTSKGPMDSMGPCPHMDVSLGMSDSFQPSAMGMGMYQGMYQGVYQASSSPFSLNRVAPDFHKLEESAVTLRAHDRTCFRLLPACWFGLLSSRRTEGRGIMQLLTLSITISLCTADTSTALSLCFSVQLDCNDERLQRPSLLTIDLQENVTSSIAPFASSPRSP